MKFAATAKLAVLGVALLAIMPARAADALLQANCTVDGKQAGVQLDKAGEATMTMKVGNESYGCNLKFAAVEGPPFSENATGMLVLDLATDSCEPSANKRRVHRNVSLHLTDPATPGAEAMAVIERRTGVFQCKVGPVDMEALKALAAPAG